MFTVQINDHTFNVPETPNEVLLTNYIPFQRMYNEFCKMVVDDHVDLKTQKEMVIQMAKCVQSYFSKDVDFEDIAGMPIGDFKSSIMSLGRSETIRIDKSLSTIFNSIVNVISSYQPRIVDKDYSFTYKDKKYIISTIHRPNYKGSLTVSESIEILEAQRIAYQMKDKQGVDNVKFSELLTMIAILAREKEETFPIEQTEIDDMIKVRTKLFMDITMDVAIDIAFFLTSFGVR
jgi:hypothetical protein